MSLQVAQHRIARGDVVPPVELDSPGRLHQQRDLKTFAPLGAEEQATRLRAQIRGVNGEIRLRRAIARRHQLQVAAVAGTNGNEA
jgi:hypothetical protein